jgi:alkanesulfonate monooxygenase SsuD/methylene tetrahydromethanopterin reductase-like flavin-dependent oxidoreductase (luciferase family)
MKVGILQFFGWRDRSILLSSIYDAALERFAIMDSNGYDAVWLAEHHFSSFSVCPSVHMMGTMAAARTKRLRIGMGVSLAPFYNPLRLAEEVALLDVLSGGRVNWGAGRGFERSEFKAFGIPGEESSARFHETVDIVLKAWTSEKLTYQGRFFSYDGVEVLPKPLQSPHPPTWMAATSQPAIDWAAGKGFSILMDPHSSRADLAAKRRHYRDKLAAAGHSDTGRVIPMARLVAVDETAEKAREIARRTAKWTVDSYVGPAHNANVRQEVRTFGGKDPIEFYLEDVMIHGTPESVADQIRALAEQADMTYLMAAPLSARSFTLLTDKVLPKIAA